MMGPSSASSPTRRSGANRVRVGGARGWAGGGDGGRKAGGKGMGRSSEGAASQGPPPPPPKPSVIPAPDDGCGANDGGGEDDAAILDRARRRAGWATHRMTAILLTGCAWPWRGGTTPSARACVVFVFERACMSTACARLACRVHARFGKNNIKLFFDVSATSSHTHTIYISFPFLKKITHSQCPLWTSASTRPLADAHAHA